MCVFIGCILIGVIVLGLIGAAAKSKPEARDSLDLERWKQSASVTVTRTRDPRASFCLANLGKTISFTYHGTRRTVTPLRVFRKPWYRKLYVLARENGQEKTFAIKRIEGIGPATTAKKPGCIAQLVAVAALVLLGLWGMSKLADRHRDEKPAAAPDVSTNAPLPERAESDAAEPPQKTTAKPVPSGIAGAPRTGEIRALPAPQGPWHLPDVAATAERPEQPKKAVPTHDPSYRTWTDATGRFSVEAQFKGCTARMVKLQKADGSELTVPLEKLSPEDQEWIHKRR